MDLELAGGVAIVTGASRGVGKAIARELALEGVDVAGPEDAAFDVTAARPIRPAPISHSVPGCGTSVNPPLTPSAYTTSAIPVIMLTWA